MATTNQETNQTRKTHPSLLQWDSAYQKTIWLIGTDVADVVIWRLLKSSASPFLGFFNLILKQSSFIWHIKTKINHSQFGLFLPCLLSPKAQRTGSQKVIPQGGSGGNGTAFMFAGGRGTPAVSCCPPRKGNAGLLKQNF